MRNKFAVKIKLFGEAGFCKENKGFMPAQIKGRQPYSENLIKFYYCAFYYNV